MHVVSRCRRHHDICVEITLMMVWFPFSNAILQPEDLDLVEEKFTLH